MLGYRVVRGTDWAWDNQDNGEGNVGTVVEIGRSGSKTPDKTLVVQWDCGTRTNYRIGYQGAFDLLVFDSAPAGIKHPSKQCDGCAERTMIRGTRWQCAQCKDYDLCTYCYMGGRHEKSHRFRRYETETSRGQEVSPRDAARAVIQSKGLFKGARVMRGYHWEWGEQDGGPTKLGKIVEIRGYQSESYRSVAQVTWDSGGTKNIYRVGHKGKVDLKYVGPGYGPSYYREHLPVCGRATVMDHASSSGEHSHFKVGEKVIVTLEVEVLKPMLEGHGGWNSKMANIRGKVGVVHRLTTAGDVRVQYDPKDFDLAKAKPSPEDFRWTFHPAALERVIDTAEQASKFQSSQSKAGTSSSQSQHESLPLDLGDYSLSSVEQNESMPSVDSVRNSMEIGTEGKTPLLEALDGPTGLDHKLINRPSNGVYPVHVVAQYFEKDRLIALQNKGANMEVVDLKGRTPLHCAVVGNKPQNVRWLMSAMKERNLPDKNGYTPLHRAVILDHTECCKEILSVKAERTLYANTKDEIKENTALHLCVSGHCNLDIVHLVVEAGADVDELNGAGVTCVALLVEKSTENLLSRIRLPHSGKLWNSLQSTMQKHNLVDKDGFVPRILATLCYLVLNGARVENAASKLPFSNWQQCVSTCASNRSHHTTLRCSQESFPGDNEPSTSRYPCRSCNQTACVKFDPCGHVVVCKKCSYIVKKCLQCGVPITNKTCDGKPLANVESTEDSNSCTICMDRKINTVLSPCNHMLSCQECSKMLKQCPVCREPIDKRVKVFPTF
uniref:RING-type E3 ubiquitin transferase n=1 Tax=Ciona intestinalis TaxID=7719 RepID=Q1RL83_CIOIN|nr:zinc finger protein Ci-ZF(ZZ/RING)-1 [Ciona intestinalis]XP_018671186.1 zinc finger protein Ci-ZF(ZZ/RING)-1 isoform X2 [Ciona intestinalis]FAA00182.1 TPA: zinc finger protein [Ciona intestinalis]|eukprot:NP_001121594.1 zinc finger protein Ci-ZF(ZZ/RING)-1 [Ciona intestinalis]